MPARKYLPDANGDLVPEGVELYDPEDYDHARQVVFDNVKKAFEGTFPRTYGKVRLELEDLHYEGPERVTPQDETEAVLKDKYLYTRLRGTARLFDTETDEELDSRKLTLTRVPVMTDRGTFIHGGNDYTSIRQRRLIPGIYHRRRTSGDFSAQFNVKRGTGRGFHVSLEPETGIFRMEIGGSKIPMYNILTNLGYTDADLEKAWGSDLLDKNKKKASGRDWSKFFTKMTGPRGTDVTDLSEQIAMVRESVDNLTFNEDAVRRTIPTLFS